MSQHVLAGLRGRAAVHDLTVKTEAMLEPLLEEGGASSVSSSGSDEEDSLYSASTVAVEVKQTAGQVIKTVVGESVQRFVASATDAADVLLLTRSFLSCSLSWLDGWDRGFCRSHGPCSCNSGFYNGRSGHCACSVLCIQGVAHCQTT